MSASNICRKSVTKIKTEANLTASVFFYGFGDILNRISDNKKGRRYATTLVSFYSMVDEMTGSTPACVQNSHLNVSQHNGCARLPDASKLFYPFYGRKSINPCNFRVYFTSKNMEQSVHVGRANIKAVRAWSIYIRNGNGRQ